MTELQIIPVYAHELDDEQTLKKELGEFLDASLSSKRSVDRELAHFFWWQSCIWIVSEQASEKFLATRAAAQQISMPILQALGLMAVLEGSEADCLRLDSTEAEKLEIDIEFCLAVSSESARNEMH
jgi:hypothetical protein